MLDSDITGPIDLGGPSASIADFGRNACELAGTGWVEFVFVDPATNTRPPDLACTRAELDWYPTTALPVEIHHTLDWMRSALRTSG